MHFPRPSLLLFVPSLLAVTAIFIYPLPTRAQEGRGLIRAVPLAGGDLIQKLPAPLRNLFQSASEIGDATASWVPPALSGRGEQISRAAQDLLRAAISLILTALAWCISLATHAVAIVASIAIGIINWLLALGRTL